MIALYVDTAAVSALNEFSEMLYDMLTEAEPRGRSLCCLCVGTDRATGDSLGPIVGQRLSESSAGLGLSVYGTLDAPVHAQNLSEAVFAIYRERENPFVVAVDAGLGPAERVGFLQVGYGGVVPGSGLRKNLAPVGDIFITGIVNAVRGAADGLADFHSLQNTRLATVMRLADVVYAGVLSAVLKLRQAIPRRRSINHKHFPV